MPHAIADMDGHLWANMTSMSKLKLYLLESSLRSQPIVKKWPGCYNHSTSLPKPWRHMSRLPVDQMVTTEYYEINEISAKGADTVTTALITKLCFKVHRRDFCLSTVLYHHMSLMLTDGSGISLIGQKACHTNHMSLHLVLSRQHAMNAMTFAVFLISILLCLTLHKMRAHLVLSFLHWPISIVTKVPDCMSMLHRTLASACKESEDVFLKKTFICRSSTQRLEASILRSHCSEMMALWGICSFQPQSPHCHARSVQSFIAPLQN